MNATRMNIVVLVAGGWLTSIFGCEGWDRHSSPPTDYSEPPARVAERARVDRAGLAEDIERMMQLRQDYLDQLTKLEKIYFESGDLVRANWARRQRDLTNAVTVYPYATVAAPEQSAVVRPEQAIPEADALYGQALELIQSFRKIPLAGTLKGNQEKAAQAVVMLKDLLRKYPRSDKVDDAAYWIGECYKEYLREDDPDNALALRYYQWALELDPHTPHPVRFQMAVVLDYRMHDHKRALEMYRRVIDDNETYHPTNPPYAAARIKELTDEHEGRDRPREDREPQMDESGAITRSGVAGESEPSDQPPGQ